MTLKYRVQGAGEVPLDHYEIDLTLLPLQEVTSGQLHHAKQKGLIMFKNIRFVCSWSRTSPGFYAAVNITKKGLWSNVVTRHARTF